MNKDEMIKDIRAIIDDRCEAELGQVHAESKGGKVTKTVSTSLIAKDIYNAGYRKVAEDEIIINTEEHTKILDRILKTGRREGYTLGREYVEGRDKLVAKDFAKSIIFATEGDDSDETMKIEDFHNTIREILKRVYNEEIGW